MKEIKLELSDRDYNSMKDYQRRLNGADMSDEQVVEYIVSAALTEWKRRDEIRLRNTAGCMGMCILAMQEAGFADADIRAVIDEMDTLADTTAADAESAYFDWY